MAIRIAAFYAAYFAIIGVALPYLPVWLAEVPALDADAIGWILGAALWPRVLVLVIGRAADRLGERKRPMILLAAIATVSLAGFGLTSDFWPLFLLSAAWGLTHAGVMPLGEALALHEGRRLGLDYGRMRLWGSLAFIVAALGLGPLIDQAGGRVILACLIGTSSAMLIACLLLPDARVAPQPERGSLRELLHQPGFLGILMAAGLIQTSHAVYYGFGTLHWQTAGLSGGLIGWLWAEGVVAEVILFAVSGVILRRVRSMRLLWIAGLLTTIRWVGTALTSAPEALVMLQLLHAASFAATHLATMFYLRDALPPHLHATGQAALTASIAILMGAAMPLCGLIYEAFGGLAFLFAAATAAAGGLVALQLSVPTADRPAPRGS